jgi:two-component system sensor histidine kinase/response regulator
MALLTDDRYASCTAWKALVRLFPQELVALPRKEEQLLRIFPGLRSIWFRVEDHEGYLPSIERLRACNPECQLIVILPQFSRDAASALYGHGVTEVLGILDFESSPDFVLRLELSLQRRRQETLRFKAREEALQQALERKQEQLAWLSHEIRTPMNGLMGMTEILRSTQLEPEQIEMIDVMARCTRKIVDQATEALDLVRIEVGKMPIERHTFDVRQLIEDSLHLYARDANARGVIIYDLVAAEVPLAIIGDERKLSQILNNLISNAVKYTERGHVMVALHCDAVTEDACALRFEIQDTGFGMSSEEQELVFAPFVQTSSCHLSRSASSGIGMTLVKQLVELLGGKIHLESQLGRGTVIELEVTFGVEQAEPRIASPARSMPRAVVVSAQEERADILRKMLESDGLIVDLRGPEEPLPDADFYFFGDRQDWESSQEGSVGTTLRGRTYVLRNPILEKKKSQSLPFGCHFLDLPLRQSEIQRCIRPDGLSKPVVAPRSLQASPRVKARVLVVDDDPLNLHVAKKQLDQLVVQVSLASSGQEALRLLETEHFDLIFVDCQMPEMDGFELLGHLRNLPQRTERVPVIALTGRARIEDRRKIMEDGFDDLLPKPAGSPDMAKMLNKWLSSERSTEHTS